MAAIVLMVTGVLGAQSPDPSALPLLSPGAIAYVGGFRLPAQSVNGDSFSFGGRVMALNAAGNSLFVSSRAGNLAEVTIPATPVNSTDVNQMPFAEFLQGFSDPMEGRLGEVSSDGAAIAGLMVQGGRLHGTASIYYDANNTQRLSHFSRSLRLDQSSFSGWSQVWDAGNQGFVAGMMSTVPPEWQSRLGGPAITGQCCIPVVYRTSWGPAAFVFEPTHVGQPSVGATPLVYYTGAHPTLGPWDASNPTYGATIQMGGVTIINGTRTLLYVGRNGTGPNCYGNGTGNPLLDQSIGPDGALWCYDPTSSDKGSHAYPYRYQLWAYDLNDLAAVRNGTRQPWDVVPYGVWPIDLPVFEPGVKVGGVGYDAERRLLYISQLSADVDGFSFRPVIHVLQVNAAVPPTVKVRGLRARPGQ